MVIFIGVTVIVLVLLMLLAFVGALLDKYALIIVALSMVVVGLCLATIVSVIWCLALGAGV